MSSRDIRSALRSVEVHRGAVNGDSQPTQYSMRIDWISGLTLAMTSLSERKLWCANSLFGYMIGIIEGLIEKSSEKIGLCPH